MFVVKGKATETYELDDVQQVSLSSVVEPAFTQG
jgi:hypothetical protein